MRLLVVEDEKKVASFIQQGLAEEGYAVDVASDGAEGLALALERMHDLIFLDIRLPKMDGLQVLPALRQERVATPVLLLTVRATIEDKVLGLDAGADDYLTKPFPFRNWSHGCGPSCGGVQRRSRLSCRWVISASTRRAAP